MIYTYCFLDLPAPPQSIIDAAYVSLENRAEQDRVNALKQLPGYSEYQYRTITKPDGSTFTTAGTHRYAISEEFEQWVRDHFQQEPKGCGISIFDSVGPALAPHVDASRNFTVQYLLDAGGDNVETVWYREKGRDIVRPDLRANFDPAATIDRYDRVEEIDRVRLPVGQWACLHANILHSVENVEHPRIGIQISRDTPPDNIKWTYISEINTF
jgi:hypothetical protein